MRRLFIALLICLLPLQSFAGVGMGVKMVGMEMQMAASPQEPCHEPSQPMQAASQDCCSSQAMCQAACPVLMVSPFATVISGLALPVSPFVTFGALFQSADPRAGFKPPIL